MEISAAQVKELREKTGVGLMNCKKALAEANGDMEEAVKYLREKGLASASKKAERSTNEGKIFARSSADNTQSVIVEVNCETDFVASNDDFQALGDAIANALINSTNIATNDDLEQLQVDNKSLKDFLSEYILKLGENISVKRFNRIQSSSPNTAYIHMNGKIGVIAGFDATLEDELAKSIAMQIAAANPTYIRPEDVSAEDIDNEKGIIRTQVLNEGKPEQIVDKIVEGKIQKYFKEVCLLEQAYIIDDKKAVKNVLPNGSTVTAFYRYSLA